MFLFDKEYFAERIVAPGGLARYTAEFIVQFFNYVMLGGVIMALLLMLLQQCTWQIARKHSKAAAWYWLSFVPVIALWYYMGDINVKLTLAVSILIVMAACLCYPDKENAKGKAVNLTYICIMIPLLLWFSGPSVLIFILLAINWIIRRGYYKSGIACIVIELIVIAVIFSTNRLNIFPHPLYRLFYGIGFNLQIEECPTMQFIVMVLFAAIPIVTGYLPAMKDGRRTQGLCYGSMAGIVVLGAIAVNAGFDRSNHDALKYNMLVRGQKWNKIIEMAEERNPDLPTTVASLNLALGMNGQLSERGMSFYQNGWQGAFPNFNRSYIISVCLSEIYHHLGLINSAQRLAFEANEAIPDYNKSARLMKRLAETNIVNGEYAVARKYLLLLKKTFFYSKWAEETLQLMNDEDALNQHPYYGYMRKVHLTEDFLFSDAEIDKIMGQLIMHDKSNNLAIQYLLFLPQLEGNQQKYLMYLDYVQKRLREDGDSTVNNDSIANDKINE